MISQDIAYSKVIVPLYFASLTGTPSFYEVHDFPEKNLFFYKHMLRSMKWILSTNQWKKDKLKEPFGLHGEKILVEPNAVSLESFGKEMTKAEARVHLSLPDDRPIVLYTGHLYGWKGVGTLAQASQFIPNANIYFVGGTKKDSEHFLKEYGDTPNIRLIGHRPHAEIPYWQSAADVLVLPNTAKEKISAFYTSLMKLFEYMASGRPIVASDLPSIRQITGDDTAVLCEADNPHALADSITRTLGDSVLCDKVSRLAKEKVKEHTWGKRAKRIGDFIALSRP
ncbi:glycosyltransferase [Candidatus Parcubacteria bacterium]|nr:glycosyltransferase [Candidatus Parcubacteria bacterium]